MANQNMLNEQIYKMLKENFGVKSEVIDFCNGVLEETEKEFSGINARAIFNQGKVLSAMQKNRLSDVHFLQTTGYGYNDLGREAFESIYADIFGAESALVRPQLISGTHALTVAMFGNLKYGDEILSPVGLPYDTLQGVIGIRKTKGSLIDNGITYKQVDLLEDGGFDYEGIRKAITSKTKFVTIQRSKGYAYRKSFLISEMKELISFIRDIKKDLIIMVDNCYGEFVDYEEPTQIGADLAVGSLIKNAGGGISPVGGYIVGREEYVENAAIRLTAPGLGKEVGPTLGVLPSLIQGLFLAPTVTANCLKNAVFAASIYEKLGFETMPKSREKRSDIVQAIKFGDEKLLIKFCQGIQKAAAVDSYVMAEPWAMPGYDCDIIMASGSFISGSSVELSADAPIKPPYIAFFQGGLTWEHGFIGNVLTLNDLVLAGVCRV